MSGDTCSPRCSKSSPVLTTNDNSSGFKCCVRPSASFAPPTPPVIATKRAAISAEHVFFERADDVARGLRAVFRGKAAHQRDRRLLGGFAHDERCGGRNRIGAIDERDLQFAAEDVVAATPIVEHRDTRAADCAADRAEAPRTIHAVADDDAGAHTGLYSERLAD